MGQQVKKYFFVSFGLCAELSGLFSDIWSDIFSLLFLAMQHARSTEIDSGISQATRDSNKISTTKNIFSGNCVETAITAEKTALREIILTYGVTIVILSSSLAISALKRKISLRIVCFILTKAINHLRTIRKFTMPICF